MARNKYEQSFINKIVQEYNEGKTKSQIKKEYGHKRKTAIDSQAPSGV